jgi:Family of unknown function (DUF6335)
MAKKKAARGRAAKKSAKKARRAPVRRAKSVPRRATARRKSAKSANRATKAKKRVANNKKSVAKKRSTAPKTRRAAAPRKSATPARRPPTLDRVRRTVDTDIVPTPPSSLNMDRSASAARSGREEMKERQREHTSTSPALTAGDVDADWEAAETTGDEAPGGDNPTPDQDVAEEIGKALGVEYDDDEELKGGDEIVERDRKRWELDPASSDDFDDR